MARYQAGTVFLQVVPSYDRFMKILKKDFDGQVSKGMQETMSRSMDEAGVRSADSFNEGHTRGMKKHEPQNKKAAQKLGKSLGDELTKTSGATDKWARDFNKRMDGAREKLGHTEKGVTNSLRRVQTAFNKGKIDARAAEKEIDIIAARMANQQVNSGGRGKANLKAAMGDIMGADETKRLLAAENAAKAAASKETRRIKKEEYDQGVKDHEKAQRKIEQADQEVADAEARHIREIEKEQRDSRTRLSAAKNQQAKRDAKALDDELTEIRRARHKAEREEVAAEVTRAKNAERARAKELVNQRKHADEAIRYDNQITQQKKRNAESEATHQRKLNQGVAAARQRLADRDESHRRRNKPGNAASRGAGRITNILTGSGTKGGDGADGPGGGANAFRGFNAMLGTAIALGSVLAPILATLVGAIGAMIPILMGAASGLGVFALALSGIRGAVEAMGKAQDATNPKSKAYQKQLEAAARAAAAAERAIRKAERSLIRSHEALAQTRKMAGRAIEEAIERQKRAEMALVAAQRASIKAQQDLVKARIKAAKDIRDLENNVVQNRLDERSGVIAVFESSMQKKAVDADPGATNLEREKADISHEQAKLSLKQIREAQKDLGEEKAKSDKEGINGSERVLDAQERLNKAILNEKEARKDVARAARDLDDQREASARRIRDAIEAVRDAEERLQEARDRAAEAQRDYNDALKGGATAIDELAEAMAKLSPAGQRFAKFIFSLKEGFDALRKSAQEGLLPGLQRGLEQIMGVYGSGFKKWVVDMSSDLGNIMELMGARFTSGGFPEFFEAFGRMSRTFTFDALMASTNWLEGFANMIKVAEPYLYMFSNWLHGVSERFKNWTASEEGQNSMTAWFEKMSETMPRVAKFFGKFVKAFLAISAAMGTLSQPIMEALGVMFDKISNAKPETVERIMAALIGFVMAMQISLGILVLLKLFALMASAPVLLAIASIIGISAALYLLRDDKTFSGILDQIQPLIDILKELGEKVFGNLVEIWEENVLPGLKKLGDAFMTDLLPSILAFWEAIKPFVFWLLDFLSDALGKAIDGAVMFFEGFFKVVGGLLDVITGVFTGDWSAIKKGLKKIFDGIWKMIKGALKFIWNAMIFSLGGGLKLLLKGAWKLLVKLPGFLTQLGPRMMKLGGRLFVKLLEVIVKVIGRIIQFFKDFVSHGLPEALRRGWASLKKAGKWLFDKLYLEVLVRIGKIYLFFWRFWTQRVPKVIQDAWGSIKSGLGKLFKWIGDWISKRIAWIAGKFKNLFPPSVQKSIKAAFAKLKGFIMNPLNLAIEVVINGGIFAAIRAIKKLFGVGNEKTPKNINTSGKKRISQRPYHTGGIAGITQQGGVLPGHTPGRDVINAKLSGGEAIMRPEFTAAVGPGWVNAMNKMARSGSINGITRAMGGGGHTGPRRYAKGGVVMPANGRYSSPFGMRRNPYTGRYGVHDGLDIAAPAGSGIYAFKGGRARVTHPGWAGNLITIGHGQGFSTSYAHMYGSGVHVKDGDKVKAGQRIGSVGSAGNSTGPHLHFMTRLGGRAVNPMPFLNGAGIPKGFGGKVADWLRGLNEKAKTWGPGKVKEIWSIYKKLTTGAGKGMKGAGPFGKLMGEVPGKLWGSVKDWAKRLFTGDTKGSKKSTLYDNGGWLQPGHTSVMNKTGKPEPVFTAEQWNVLKGNLAHNAAPTGEQHYHWHDAVSTPNDFAAAINRSQRREARKVSSRLPSGVR